MKKLILTTLLISGLMVSAQQYDKPARVSSENKEGKVAPLNPEQRIALRLKKMTLDLDLTETQQVEVKKVLEADNQQNEAKWAELKEKKGKHGKLTNEERFALQNEILDRKIEMKAALKNILSPEQMTKWEATLPKKGNIRAKRN
jgi:protein CpxP